MAIKTRKSAVIIRGSKGSKSLFEMDSGGEQLRALHAAISLLVPGEDRLALVMARGAFGIFDAWTTAKAELAEENE